MKRSEVIKLITGLYECGTDFDSDTRAHNLLAQLEQLGMLPNTFHFLADDSYCNAKDILHELTEPYDGQFEWEPEDDT